MLGGASVATSPYDHVTDAQAERRIMAERRAIEARDDGTRPKYGTSAIKGGYAFLQFVLRRSVEMCRHTTWGVRSSGDLDPRADRGQRSSERAAPSQDSNRPHRRCWFIHLAWPGLCLSLSLLYIHTAQANLGRGSHECSDDRASSQRPIAPPSSSRGRPCASSYSWP